MRVIVVGLGVQGVKRRKIAGDEVVAVVDPFSPDVQYKSVEMVPVDSYDAALVCTPDDVKFSILRHLLSHGKHVLVEKPLLFKDAKELSELRALSQAHKATCYTAYNHRFEPHFVRMKEAISSGMLGKIYSVRMFYGNGTARLVRESAWRDQGAGVLPDLGSHLLDTLLFWLDDSALEFSLLRAHRFENKSFDHVVFTGNSSAPFIECEMTLLSWRNHFTADVFAEKGSAHISSLCKWGPSTFTLRRRVLPSGRPPEESVTLVSDDPTWQLEYDYFKELCGRAQGNLENDVWIQKRLDALSTQAHVLKEVA